MQAPILGQKVEKDVCKCAEKGYELAKKVGAISAQSHLGAHLAGMYFGEGEIDTALLLIEESVALNRKTGNLHDLPLFLVPLGQCYMVLGEWEKSEKYFNEALMIAQKTNHVTAAAQTCMLHRIFTY